MAGGVAFALGLIEDERAVEPLSAALRDQIVAVRARAAWALGVTGDGRRMEPDEILA